MRRGARLGPCLGGHPAGAPGHARVQRRGDQEPVWPGDLASRCETARAGPVPAALIHGLRKRTQAMTLALTSTSDLAKCTLVPLSPRQVTGEHTQHPGFRSHIFQRLHGWPRLRHAAGHSGIRTAQSAYCYRSRGQVSPVGVTLLLMGDHNTPREGLTLAEIADRVGVAKMTARRYLDAGKFPNAVREDGRADGRWLVPWADVQTSGIGKRYRHSPAPADPHIGTPVVPGGESIEALLETLRAQARTIEQLTALVARLTGSAGDGA